MIYVFDLDHTLCDTKRSYDESGKGSWEYYESTPYKERIEVVNKLWSEGHTIIIETARGCGSKINHYEDTFNQLRSWGLKFTSLRTGVKFGADYFIDDKGINSEDFFNGIGK
tara:strand:+ start:807 stop:1142 length:336 start_codon:yes stop_codon:yes gene_type:complete